MLDALVPLGTMVVQRGAGAKGPCDVVPGTSRCRYELLLRQLPYRSYDRMQTKDETDFFAMYGDDTVLETLRRCGSAGQFGAEGDYGSDSSAFQLATAHVASVPFSLSSEASQVGMAVHSGHNNGGDT